MPGDGHVGPGAPLGPVLRILGDEIENLRGQRAGGVRSAEELTVISDVIESTCGLPWLSVVFAEVAEERIEILDVLRVQIRLAVGGENRRFGSA